MPTRRIPNRQIVPAATALGALAAWLKPGKLAFRVGQLRAALNPVAEALARENERLLDAFAIFETVGGERRRKTIDLGNGMQKFVLTDEAAYLAAERDLFEGDSEIVYTTLLTEDHVNAIESHYAPDALRALARAARGDDPAPGESFPSFPRVDFLALACVMDDSLAPKVDAETSERIGREREALAERNAGRVRDATALLADSARRAAEYRPGADVDAIGDAAMIRAALA